MKEAKAYRYQAQNPHKLVDPDHQDALEALDWSGCIKTL